MFKTVFMLELTQVFFFFLELYVHGISYLYLWKRVTVSEFKQELKLFSIDLRSIAMMLFFFWYFLIIYLFTNFLFI